MANIRINGTAGNDRYDESYYDTETIFTYGGNDVVNLWVNDDYAGGQYVDTGEGNDTVYQSFNGYGEFYLGNGNDTFVSEGDGWTYGNYVDAGAGNDVLAFDTQHSTYLGGEGTDTFISTSFSNRMNGGNGIDLVSYEATDNGVKIDLLNDVAGDFGDFTLDERIFNIENARGSNFNDAIAGDNFNNILEGIGGNDTLWGQGGNDVLRGGAGNDALAAGLGNDRIVGQAGIDDMWGEAGLDTFVFAAVTDTGKTAATRDWIGDFVHGQDKIDVSFMDANIKANMAGNQAFTFIGASAFTTAGGQLHTDTVGTNTIVSGDINGDRVVDFQIELQGNIALSAADFIL
ncbi:MAG: M10 family metallopeptidase C-terminal domain-containing protein [Hyphomicrobium sp.]